MHRVSRGFFSGRWSLLAALFVAAVLPHTAFAYATTTALSGRVTDAATQSVLRRASVTPTPVAAGAAGAGVLRTSADASGAFTRNAVTGD